MVCEYAKNDGVMDYCTKKVDCPYAKLTVIKEGLSKAGEGYTYDHFPMCTEGESVLLLKALDYVRREGISDLCMPREGIEKIMDR